MSSDQRKDVRFYTDNIHTFVAVSESGGVGRAARSLGLSQPSVSQQISRLEGLIGRKLFKRGKVGVALTPDGEILLRHAQSLIEVNEAISQSFGNDGRRVRLTLGMSQMFSLTSLHRLLWLVARQNPGLSLRIILDRTEVLKKGFEEGNFDIVVAGAVDVPPRARFLRSEPLTWIGRTDAPCPVPDPVPLILPLDPSRLRTVMLEALQRADRTWDGSFEVSSVSAAEAAIEAGFGYCVALRNMPLHGPIQLDERFGLPDLPNLDYYMHRLDGRDGGVSAAFCKLVSEAVERGDG